MQATIHKKEKKEKKKKEKNHPISKLVGGLAFLPDCSLLLYPARYFILKKKSSTDMTFHRMTFTVKDISLSN